jgi:hypothetical protein
MATMGRRKREERMFFFEKKNQKTFGFLKRWVAAWAFLE